jgi:hypothetical protein
MADHHFSRGIFRVITSYLFAFPDISFSYVTEIFGISVSFAGMIDVSGRRLHQDIHSIKISHIALLFWGNPLCFLGSELM